MLAVVLAILALNVQPLPLESLGLDRARQLDGKPATVSMIAATPPVTIRGRTTIGTVERDDGAERGVVLIGNRLDVREGERITVRGRLRLIYHRGDVVNGVIVPAWFEIRVTEEK